MVGFETSYLIRRDRFGPSHGQESCMISPTIQSHHFLNQIAPTLEISWFSTRSRGQKELARCDNNKELSYFRQESLLDFAL